MKKISTRALGNLILAIFIILALAPTNINGILTGESIFPAAYASAPNTTNVALGKVATTSATFSNLNCITDGDKDTDNFSDSYPNDGIQWIILDLGSEKTIDRIKLWHYFGDGRMYRDVIIQLSNQADFLSGVTTIFNNDSDGSSGQGIGTDGEYNETSEGKTINFNATRTRYLKFWSNGSTSNSSNHYVEIEVFESAIYNLALGKNVTTSYTFTPLNKINDGNKNTNNFSDSYPNGGIQWIQLDLGSIMSVMKINIWHYYGDDRRYHDVIIQLSNTEDFSSDVTTVFNNDSDGNLGQGIGSDQEYAETSTGKSIEFDVINARYVRCWSNGSTVDSTNRYVEVEVFGSANAITNLALSKNLTMSNQFDNAGAMTDGNKDTDNYSDSYPNDGVQWVMLDLGNEMNVIGINLWHYFGDERTYHDVIIQVSNSEDFSSGVDTVFNNDLDGSSGQGIGSNQEYVETSSGKSIKFNALRGRYVRFWSNGSTSNQSNHYVEVEVLGNSLNNSALGKPITTIPNLNRITDGDKDTDFFTDSYPNEGIQWIMIDLRSEVNITGINLWHYFGDSRQYHDVIIQVSNTPDFSSGVTTVFNNDSDGSSGQGIGNDEEYIETSSGKSININAVSARYVKLWSNGSTANDSNHYVEVEVMATDPTIGFYPNWNNVGKGPFSPTPAIENNPPVLRASDVTDASADFVADPFLFYEDGNWYMFFEVEEISTGRGCIALATSTDGLNWDYDGIVLREKHHLALPHVFKYGNDYYMVPDTGGTINDLKMYKADNFPYDWSYYTTIATSERGFLDIAIVPYNGKFWLFTSDITNSNSYLYYSDNLTSGWTEHPKNPIISDDPAKARIGGRSFVYNGKLIRIAQKCDLYYGEKVRAFEVDTITTTDYAEHEIPESPLLSPGSNDWNATNMHTFDPWWIGDKWLIAVDGYNGSWSIGIYKSE